MEFQPFPKIARLSRECVITEKIDGTNASVTILDLTTRETPMSADMCALTLAQRDHLVMFVGSRTRWITPSSDNQGFARWAQEHANELFTLGPGQHFGEWWGSGINRGYGLAKGEKRFSLFNTARWHMAGAEPQFSVSQDPRQPPRVSQEAPACCSVVPLLYRGEFDTECIYSTIDLLSTTGSIAAPGFANPEGIVIYHTAANLYFKKMIEKDEQPKLARTAA